MKKHISLTLLGIGIFLFPTKNIDKATASETDTIIIIECSMSVDRPCFAVKGEAYGKGYATIYKF